jgi:hypothetical protein
MHKFHAEKQTAMTQLVLDELADELKILTINARKLPDEDIRRLIVQVKALVDYHNRPKGEVVEVSERPKKIENL